MNYTDQQIRLTDISEIQDNWNPDNGHPVLVRNEETYLDDERYLDDDMLSHAHRHILRDYCFMPQERWYFDELMKTDKWAGEYWMLREFIDWVRSWLHKDELSYTSLDLIQAFYMRIKFNKVRSGSEWKIST